MVVTSQANVIGVSMVKFEKPGKNEKEKVIIKYKEEDSD